MIIKEKYYKIQDFLDKMAGNGIVAGASCVIFQAGHEIGYFESGYADRENLVPIRRDTIFHLFSMTKSITATAVMKLLAEGKIHREDPVSYYIDTFKNQQYCDGVKLIPASGPVTIDNLLNMTSGLTYGGLNTLCERETSALIIETEKRAEMADAYDTVEFCRLLGKCPLQFDPGSGFQYGLSADVLGAIIEVVSGMRFSDYLKENLFVPLGMKDTDFYVPAHKRERLAKMYMRSPDGLKRYNGSNLSISNTMKNRPAFESGGAGLVSTIDDYLAFSRMLLQDGVWDGKRILPEGIVNTFENGALTKEQQSFFDRDMPHLSGYSYGNLMRVMKDPSSARSISYKKEFGWDGWLGTYYMVDRFNDLTFVYMQQVTDTGTTDWTFNLRDLVYEACQKE